MRDDREASSERTESRRPLDLAARPKGEDLMEMQRKLWMGELDGVEAIVAEALVVKYPPADCN